jgi:prepilin peptidase CpaA
MGTKNRWPTGGQPILPPNFNLYEINYTSFKMINGRAFMADSNHILSLGLLVALIIATITDIKEQKIYNWLTGSLLMGALIFHITTNGLDGLVFSIKGLGVGVCLLIIPFILGGMGGGDAKLMGGVGAALGAKGVFYSFIFTGLFGGVYAFLIILFNRNHFQGIGKRYLIKLHAFIHTNIYIPDPDPPVRETVRLCYGVVIALGTFTYMGLMITGFVFPI